MPTPIDLSAPQPVRSSPRKNASKRGRGRGTGTRADDYARTVFQIAIGVGLLMLIYLLYGLYGGALANPNFDRLAHADRLRNLDSIAFAFNLLRLTVFVAVASMLICSFRDEGIGYALLVVAAFFFLALPFLTNQIYDWQGLRPSRATKAIVGHLQSLAVLFAAPGIFFTLWDFVRRFQTAAQLAAIQRASVTYGSNVQKQPVAKQKQRFLGRCWELPYCRDHIRVHCPVYMKKQGPCWWYKEGCMCEERIILQATIHKDWKSQAAKASDTYNFGESRSKHLTPAAKRERCRNCVIYNEHQRQKYKLLTTIAVVGTPVLLWLNSFWMQSAVVTLLAGLEKITERFTFGESKVGVSFLHGNPSVLIEWVVIGALGLILLSQVLKVIEYVCFKIKF